MDKFPSVPTHNVDVSPTLNLPVQPQASTQDINSIKNRRNALFVQYNKLLYENYVELLRTCPLTGTLIKKNEEIKSLISEIARIDANLGKGGTRRKCIYKKGKRKNKTKRKRTRRRTRK